jgi:hypothetical protein
MERFSHHLVNLEVHGAFIVVYQCMDAFIVLGRFKTVMGKVITCRRKFVWIEAFL